MNMFRIRAHKAHTYNVGLMQIAYEVWSAYLQVDLKKILNS